MVTPQRFATSGGSYCGKCPSRQKPTHPKTIRAGRCAPIPQEAGNCGPVLPAQGIPLAKRWAALPAGCKSHTWEECRGCGRARRGKGLAKEQSGGGQRGGSSKRPCGANGHPCTRRLPLLNSRLFRKSHSGNRNATRILPNYPKPRFFPNKRTKRERIRELDNSRSGGRRSEVGRRSEGRRSEVGGRIVFVPCPLSLDS
jgi:hypothetical protein